MSKEKEIKFDKPINGFIAARKEIIAGQEVWIKIAPTRVANGVKQMPNLLKKRK
jgi:hypothetical protein